MTTATDFYSITTHHRVGQNQILNIFRCATSEIKHTRTYTRNTSTRTNTGVTIYTATGRRRRSARSETSCYY